MQGEELQFLWLWIQRLKCLTLSHTPLVDKAYVTVTCETTLSKVGGGGSKVGGCC